MRGPSSVQKKASLAGSGRRNLVSQVSAVSITSMRSSASTAPSPAAVARAEAVVGNAAQTYFSSVIEGGQLVNYIQKSYLSGEESELEESLAAYGQAMSQEI